MRSTKAMEEPNYLGSVDYTKLAQDAVGRGKALIDKLGLAGAH